MATNTYIPQMQAYLNREITALKYQVDTQQSCVRYGILEACQSLECYEEALCGATKAACPV